MAVWFRSNKVTDNISKTKYMIFKIKGKILKPDIPDLVYNENEPNIQNPIP
jgi:hypothetical protein